MTYKMGKVIMKNRAMLVNAGAFSHCIQSILHRFRVEYEKTTEIFKRI